MKKKDSSFNQIEYMNEYNKNHYRCFRVMAPTSDTELIEWMEDHKPYSTYILNLIRKDIEKNKKC